MEAEKAVLVLIHQGIFLLHERNFTTLSCKYICTVLSDVKSVSIFKSVLLLLYLR
jgi:hypothetical protein